VVSKRALDEDRLEAGPNMSSDRVTSPAGRRSVNFHVAFCAERRLRRSPAPCGRLSRGRVQALRGPAGSCGVRFPEGQVGEFLAGVLEAICDSNMPGIKGLRFVRVQHVLSRA
jgi:hypothetical protein